MFSAQICTGQRRSLRVWLAFLSLSAVVGTMSPALAQSQTAGHAWPASPATIPEVSASEARQARITLTDYSRCLVWREPKAVRKLISMPPMALATRKAMHSLATSECLYGGTLKMNEMLFRGSLFINLYQKAYGSVPPPVSSTPVDFATDVVGAAPEDAAQYVGLRQLADCAARADPVGSRAVVLAPVSSPAERTAFANLSPQLNACAYKGQSLHFNKSLLAGLLAEVLYRDAPAEPVTPRTSRASPGR